MKRERGKTKKKRQDIKKDKKGIWYLNRLLKQCNVPHKKEGREERRGR